jgi:hypothetical protein
MVSSSSSPAAVDVLWTLKSLEENVSCSHSMSAIASGCPRLIPLAASAPTTLFSLGNEHPDTLIARANLATFVAGVPLRRQEKA